MDPRAALRLHEDDSKREGEARSGDGTPRKGEVRQEDYMKEKLIVYPNLSPAFFSKVFNNCSASFSLRQIVVSFSRAGRTERKNRSVHVST